MKRICLIFLILIFLHGCGGKAAITSSSSQGLTMEVHPSAAPMPMPNEDYTGETQLGEAEAYTEKDKKIIKTGDMELAAEKYNEALEGAQNITENYGGYVEDLNVHVVPDDRRGGSFKNAVLTLRIPAGFYEAAKEEISNLGRVESYSQRSEDITTAYYDTEVRLNTKRAEEARLLELLANAKATSDIIALRSRLTDVRTEIEIYESRVTAMNNKVSYSTLHLNIIEDTGFTINPPEELSDKIVHGLEQSIRDTRGLLENIIIGLAYSFLPLCLLITAAAVGLWLRKKYHR